MPARKTPKPHHSPLLPQVLINVAMTADGKIAPVTGQFEPFGGEADHLELLRLRATADAVMSGARTINSFPMTLGPGGRRFRQERQRRGLTEYNLRVIVSGSGSINPQAKIFRHRFSPIIILTTGRIPERKQDQLRKAGAEIEICGRSEVDFHEALRRLRARWGIKRLLCEGGGQLNDAVLRAGLVDEVHLTICPLVLGGARAPTLADGLGFADLAHALSLQLKTLRRDGDNLFLTYTTHSGKQQPSRSRNRRPDPGRKPRSRIQGANSICDPSNH